MKSIPKALNIGFQTLLGALTTGLLSSGILLPVIAQVTSDGTTKTTVNSSGNNFNILNGIEKGNNLFHSFTNFSVPTSGSATFDLTNTPNITNIFSRVTGGNASNINGLIQTLNSNNPVNLFLMNPSGIIFGPDASLNISGSFVGTTADSIKFADGFKFNANEVTAPTLLTMSVPVGLQLGANAGSITVQGSGHHLIIGDFTPINRSNNPMGLQVGTGNTLALIGSEINFWGGIVAVDGHLEVGSVSDGQVTLNPILTGWTGDYSQVRQFHDIHLAQQSLLDASGSRGSIKLQGQNINLTEGSVVLIQNFGSQAFEGITVNATQSLNLTGNTLDGRLGNLIQIDNLGTGQTGDISIFAAQLSLKDGGQITSQTFTQAVGGNITVNVAGSIDIVGFAAGNPDLSSSILKTIFNSNNTGNITVSSDNLRILDSASIASLTLGSGKAGMVQVNATDLIEIAGNNPITLIPSTVTSTTLNSGDANNLLINTSRLVIRDGAAVGSLTLFAGSAGGVTINASKSFDIRGRGVGSRTSSRVISGAEILDPITQAALGVPSIPTGNAAYLTINTPSLRITDGAIASVKNDGPGRAGDLQINARSILLDHQGAITASTASGNGGNIGLNLQNYLLIRDEGMISATAAGKGDGGNLLINTPVIIGLENGDIIANAMEGRGGNIQITAQGIFGLQFRDQLTPDSDITASSQFGVSGNVQVNTIDVDPSSGLVSLPVNVTDPSQQITSGCSTISSSRFVATGRGGIPQNPTQEVRSDRSWSDLRDLSPYRKTGEVTAQIPASPQTLVQATSWYRNALGKIELVTDDKSSVQVQQPLNCAVVSQN